MAKNKGNNQTEHKIAKWIKDACEFWSLRVYEGDTGIDWSDALDGKGRCYRCGECVYTPQKCHIIPRSLGGTNETGNIIPLCRYCHDEQPDVIDPSATWDWIKATRPDGYGYLRWSRVLSAVNTNKYDINTFSFRKFKSIIKKSLGCHLMQNGTGPRIKDNSFAWAVEKACKELGEDCK